MSHGQLWAILKGTYSLTRCECSTILWDWRLNLEGLMYMYMYVLFMYVFFCHGMYECFLCIFYACIFMYLYVCICGMYIWICICSYICLCLYIYVLKHTLVGTNVLWLIAYLAGCYHLVWRCYLIATIWTNTSNKST